MSQNPEVPAEEESLFESGYLDSFALPEVITALEKEFGVKIPDSDLNPRKFESISKIERYLAARLA
ncbi:MAG: acyl carrier protein [Bryobacteraceae bacterium]